MSFLNNQALGQCWLRIRTQETSAYSKFYLLEKIQRILGLAGKLKKDKTLEYLFKHIHVQVCRLQGYNIFNYHKICYFLSLLNFIIYWTEGRSKGKLLNYQVRNWQKKCLIIHLIIDQLCFLKKVKTDKRGANLKLSKIYFNFSPGRY